MINMNLFETIDNKWESTDNLTLHEIELSQEQPKSVETVEMEFQYDIYTLSNNQNDNIQEILTMFAIGDFKVWSWKTDQFGDKVKGLRPVKPFVMKYQDQGYEYEYRDLMRTMEELMEQLYDDDHIKYGVKYKLNIKEIHIKKIIDGERKYVNEKRGHAMFNECGELVYYDEGNGVKIPGKVN